MDELEALRRDLAAERRENAALRDQVTQLVKQVASLNERVAELLAIALRKQRKTRAATQQRREFDERPKPPEKAKTERGARRKAKPTGRSDSPATSKRRSTSCGPMRAAHAADTRSMSRTCSTKRNHVVKEHQRRRVVRRYTCRCRACGERTTLRSLPAPYDRSKVTCEWLVWFVYQTFWLLTPLDRIPRDLGERGIPLAMGTLVSFIERAADLLSGIDGLHWKRLLAGRWVSTDGTGIKVISPSLRPRTTATLSSTATTISPSFNTSPPRMATLSPRSSAVPRHPHCRRRAPPQRCLR